MAHRETERSRRGKKGEPPKSVYLTIGIWHDAKQGHIHLASRDKRFRHTTVTNDPASTLRYHPNLFNKLKAVLKAEGCWPAE